MAYDKRFVLVKAPEPRTDGSGLLDHDIQAQASEAGQDSWFDIPGKHKTISIPAQDAIDVLAGPNVAANYKSLLVANINTQPSPVTGWSLGQLEAQLVANDLASQAASDFAGLGLSYPFPFTL